VLSTEEGYGNAAKQLSNDFLGTKFAKIIVMDE
jgi:hypothetical protein